MRQMINRLREKPEQHRKKVALGVSAGVTLLIFGIWAVTLPSRLEELEPTQAAALTASAPIDSLKQNLTESLNTLTGNLGANVSGSDVSSTDNSQQSSSNVIITDTSATTSGALDQYPY